MSSEWGEKVEVITFKADAGLAAALNAMENRSEFIRQALRSSLDHRCPLCAGSGTLTPNQQRHLRAFLQHHEIRECERCHALHLDNKVEAPPAPSPLPACPSASRNRRRSAAVGRRTATALAGLFLLATMVAGMHRHEQDHKDRPETHTASGPCLTCVFAASPLLVSSAFRLRLESVSSRPLLIADARIDVYRRAVDLHARGPPLERV